MAILYGTIATTEPRFRTFSRPTIRVFVSMFDVRKVIQIVKTYGDCLKKPIYLTLEINSVLLVKPRIRDKIYCSAGSIFHSRSYARTAFGPL